jgi:hypothetical protein
MRMKVSFLSLLMVVVGFVPAIAVAQQDDDVRGAFMTTRPKATSKSSGNKSTPTTKPSHRRPKTDQGSSGATSGANGGAGSSTTPAKVNVQRLGLGLTLFMRDSNGLAIRTDPTHDFHKGDHVRFLIETNTDGYLYLFNTTDNGTPMMLYPDPELDEAGNYFQAHVPFEIPSSIAAEERLRWLTFDEHAGDERLYFVFTREPLKAVPIEDDLISFCRDTSNKCPWNPDADVWAQIQKELSEPTQTAKVAGLGKAQTSTERQAATRGIGLNRDDPEPSLIMLSASTSKNLLVVAVDLVHKSVSMLTEPDE